MTTLSNFPHIEVQYDKEQRPLDLNSTANVKAWIDANRVTDLLVLAHGWNNDIAEARALYARLVDSIAARIAAGSGNGLTGRQLGVLGLFWPSKRFADEDLIPGGAAAADGDLEDQALQAQLKSLKGFFDGDESDANIDDLVRLVENLDIDPDARAQFFKAARSLIGPASELDPDDRDEIPEFFFSASSTDEIAEIFDELKKPDPPGVSTTSTSSGAAGLSFSGFKAGARRLLNLVTYYQMKKRARQTGVNAVAPMLQSVRTSHPDLRVHLVGHSFGGLLVASTAWGGDVGAPVIPIASMSLLQAAFSHNGFAENFSDGKNGRYRTVLTQPRVSGPILVTHTHNDKAVGIAYALASRVSREDSAGIGDKDDRFGGIGANGAQHTPEHVERRLEDPGIPYHFEAGKLYNLLADDHIEDHSDVHGSAVAHAIVEGIDSTPS